MRRISAYIISPLLILISYATKIQAQDTIPIPLKIKIGLEVSGPAIYFTNKNILNTEGYFSIDLNERISPVIGAGYLNYKYSQYNYEYLNKGYFVRAGADINLLKPEKSLGKYWVGLGLRYGISRFSSEVPSYTFRNVWDTVTSSIPTRTNWGHFIEASPGVRAEVFKNFSIGWSISLRMLLYTGAGKDLRPIYFPGFGAGSKRFSSGLSYFLVWNIPYKKITVITKKQTPAETDDTVETGNSQGSTDIRQ